MVPAVRAEHVSKRYGRTLALDQCDVMIPQGSFTALVGANGAGKSTLLQLLVGILTPTAGELSVLGRIPSKQRRETLEAIGFVFQDRPLYKSLSVSDTLEMGRRLNSAWDAKLAKDRLIRMGIPLAKEVGQLSGGQQAQVSLSLALGKRPAVLILDEPMSSLDPLARQLFIDEVVSVSRQDHMTVIMSSHIIAELARVCDYVVVLQAGRVRACGTVEEAVTGWGQVAPDARRQQVSDLEQAVLSYLDDGPAGSR